MINEKNQIQIKTNSCNLNIYFIIKISSKYKKKFNEFLNLFDTINSNQNCMIWTTVSGLDRKNFITVLKSPHINKTAQEQFEYRVYEKYVIVSTFQPASFLTVMKMLQGSSFPSITLKVTLLSEIYTFDESINLLDLLDPINIILKKKKNKKLTIKNKKYVKMFDIYGELYHKK